MLYHQYSIANAPRQRVVTHLSQVSRGPYHVCKYIIQRPFRALYRIGRFIRAYVPVVRTTRFQISLRNAIGHGIRFRQRRFYRAIRLHVQGVRYFSGYLSSATNYRHAGNHGLYREVLSVFFYSMLSRTKALHVLGVRVGVQRKRALQVWGALGGGIVFSQVGIYGTNAVTRTTTHTKAAPQSSPTIVYFHPISMVPRSWSVLSGSRLLSGTGLMFRVIVSLYALHLVMHQVIHVFFLGSLLARHVRGYPHAIVTFQQYVF